MKKESLQSYLLKKILFNITIFPEIDTSKKPEKSLVLSSKNYKLPKYVRYLFGFEEIQGIKNTFELSKENFSNNKIIFYIHGGAYWKQPDYTHFSMLRNLSKLVSTPIILPVYPKAPFYSAVDVFKMLEETYYNVLERKNIEPNNVIFMGDSSGGGLVLSLLQQLRDKNEQLPAMAILLSPWLDINVHYDDMIELQKLDPILTISNLESRGAHFVGKLSTEDSKVSPLLGDLSNLPAIHVFSGTHDILYPNSVRLYNLAVKKGYNITFTEYPKMLHVFQLFPIPEAKKGLRDIVNTIIQV